MKKYLFLTSLIIALLFTLVCISGCEHKHKFSEWETVKEATCAEDGLKTRTCRCDTVEEEAIPALPHTEVTENGKNATCEKDGYTEKVYCSVCDTVITESTVIEALGHAYNSTVMKTATCRKNGTRQFSCRRCNDRYTEEISLPKYSASEIYEQSVKYVGEIITYDKDGKPLSLGSCIVISADGKIVTNYHVIEDAYSASIVINGKEYTDIGVTAYNMAADLALLKVSATDLDTAKICYEAVPTGDTIYAIGSSEGLTNTYSRGIVTSASRNIGGVTYVQHDASINSGNSGGPLINEYGEVIGINTWTVTDSQNLNFAISTSELVSLSYIDVIPMSEFYELDNSSPYKKLRNWLIENGTYDQSTMIYELYTEVQNGTEIYGCSINYDAEYDYVFVDLAIVTVDPSITYVSIDLSTDPSSYEFYALLELDGDYVNYATGYVDAYNYIIEDKLEFYEYEGFEDARDYIEELYSNSFAATVLFFEISLRQIDIGLSIQDFGFTQIDEVIAN